MSIYNNDVKNILFISIRCKYRLNTKFLKNYNKYFYNMY